MTPGYQNTLLKKITTNTGIYYATYGKKPATIHGY